MTTRDDAVTAMDTYALDMAHAAKLDQAAADKVALDAMTAERDALQAELDALRPANTFGMAVGPTSGAIADDLTNFKAVVAAHPNLGIKVRRSYTPGTKTTWVEPLPGAGILPFFSQKPDLDQMASGSLDGWAGTFAQVLSRRGVPHDPARTREPGEEHHGSFLRRRVRPMGQGHEASQPERQGRAVLHGVADAEARRGLVLRERHVDPSTSGASMPT